MSSNHLTSTPSTAPRVFQAIDGAELKQIILDEIRRTLDLDSRFQRHLTFPQFSFAFQIRLNRYPGEPKELDVEGRYRRVDPSNLPVGEPETLDLKGSLNVDAPEPDGLAPDEARERAGLPVSVPTRQPLGKSGTQTIDAATSSSALVDDPAVIASGSSSPAAQRRLENERKGLNADGTPRAPKNRKEASPNFARSINLQTRVNPDGVRVDDNLGTRGD